MKSNQYLGYIYLSLAILGAILPTIANFNFIMEYGRTFNIRLFIELANSNPASQSLTRDLAIGASAVMIWIVTESKRLDMKNVWFIVLSAITISFAFAAPLFLYFRERRLLEIESTST